jgi:hypothetical protein
MLVDAEASKHAPSSLQEGAATRNGEADRDLESFYVGDYVLDLGWLEDVFEGRHHGVAVFDPGLEGFVGDFIVVYGEGAALADAFQSGTDFL